MQSAERRAQTADCRLQTACAVLMFRCLPDVVLRPAPLSIRFNVPTLHFVLLVPFLAASLRERRPQSPLILARVRRPPTPSTELSPIFEHHFRTL